MAELMSGGSLPENVVYPIPFVIIVIIFGIIYDELRKRRYFCIILGIIAALFPILIAIFPTWEDFLPSCVAFAVAMYDFPLPFLSCQSHSNVLPHLSLRMSS
jgi:hypothetical protein